MATQRSGVSGLLPQPLFIFRKHSRISHFSLFDCLFIFPVVAVYITIAQVGGRDGTNLVGSGCQPRGRCPCSEPQGRAPPFDLSA